MEKIRIKKSNSKLSSLGGLKFFTRMYGKLNLSYELRSAIPKTRLKIKSTQEAKAMNLIYGFIAGATCIDDIKHFEKDEGFQEACSRKVLSPQALGSYLRAHDKVVIGKLQRRLIKLAIKSRLTVDPKPKKLILGIDSTTNEQSGRKIEGVGYDYKNRFGLDTIHVFDEMGFSYFADVRKGGTHTAKNADLILHSILQSIQKRNDFKNTQILVRGDAGYTIKSVIAACRQKNVDCLFRAKQYMIKPLLSDKHLKWEKTDKIYFRDGRPCEIGDSIFTFKGNGPLKDCAYRVVIIRALKSEEKTLIDSTDNYDYFGFLTSMGHSKASNEEVVLTYRDRGKDETYIRELKDNFDLRHYPCLALRANRAYCLYGQFAYNMMRLHAHQYAKSKNTSVPFAKKIRLLCISIPAVLIKTGRQKYITFMEKHLKEVLYWSEFYKNLQLVGFS